MAGTITVDKIQSDTSYSSTVNVISALVVSNTATFSNTTTHTGAATFANTLGVTGAVTLSSTLAAGNTTITGTLSVTNPLSAQTGLTAYLLPSPNDAWRGIYRAGFDWWSRNQKWGGPWGGELLDGTTNVLNRVEYATGYIAIGDDQYTIGNDAARTYRFQGFKVPETSTLSDVTLRLFKTGNPTNNLGVFIYSDDGTGKPSALITNGTATAQSGKLVTSDSTNYGTNYKFVFPTPPTLTGGTQYHIVMTSSGAVDASNYWRIAAAASSEYPFGSAGAGTATPVWSINTGVCFGFLVGLSSTYQISQSSGIFDGKLAFGGSGASNTLSMSRGLCSSVPLHNLVDTSDFTIRMVGNAFTKNATILDIGYGQDHDRIVLRSAVTTGYATLTVYDSAGTVRTVTGSTDISSGNQDIIIRVRAKNDGADAMSLYVAGASQGTPIASASISFDNQFRNLGTMWIGGGFALAPTYSGSSIGINGFSGLPSTLGWTYSGDATEASAFSVSGGKLYQNKNGYTSTQTGKYTKSTAGFSNTNGFTVVEKLRNVSSSNVNGDAAIDLFVQDGTKIIRFLVQEYFLRESAVLGDSVQQNYKSFDNVLMVQGKGLDFFAYTNNRLSYDGTGMSTNSTATNDLTIGDADSTASQNADVIYSYWKYYTTAWTPPQFTSGSISELAIFSGDKTTLAAALYNSGTLLSVKQYCGLPQNYLDKSVKITQIEQVGIASSPTTTASLTGPSVANEMEYFVIGEELIPFAKVNIYNNGSGNDNAASISIDGTVDLIAQTYATGTSNYHLPIVARRNVRTYLGLHKVTAQVGTGGGTVTMYQQKRNLIVETKV